MNNTKHQDILHLLKCHNFTKMLKEARRDAISDYPNSDDKHFPLLYESYPSISFILSQLNDFVDRIEFLDIHKPALDTLKRKLERLSNFAFNTEAKIFKNHLDSVFESIDDIYKEEIKERLKIMTCQECTRLDEAITNFRNDCFFSSVIMAVSAVEARLHYLIKAKNKTIYSKYFEKATLGTLISLFDKKVKHFSDKKFNSIKNILPEEHTPLIEVFNTYRIYSAHPKDKDVTPKIAQSILNFTFAFLLDKKLKIDEKKLLKH